MVSGTTRRASNADLKVGALIRARRRQLHLTLQELCEGAGISVGYLSQVERDLATPSLGTLAQIARSLSVSVDYFIATPNMEDGLTRADERTRFSVDGSSVFYERIAVDFAGNTLSSFLMHLPPGYHSETAIHEGEEIIYGLEGFMSLWIDGEKVVLGPGDSVHFRGNQPHAWANETDRKATQLWVGTMRLFRNASKNATSSTRKAKVKLIKPEDNQ